MKTATFRVRVACSMALILQAIISVATAQSIVTNASDGFESGDWTGGTGWSGNWAVSSGTHVLTTQKHSGTYSIDLASGNRSVERVLNLAGASEVTFSFWWGAAFLEGGEQLIAKFYDGDEWFTLQTITAVASSPKNGSFNGWYFATYSLNTSSLTGTSQKIRIETIEGATDFFYLDDFLITSPAPPLPTLITIQ